MAGKEDNPDMIEVHSTNGEFPDQVDVTDANAQATKDEDQ